MTDKFAAPWHKTSFDLFIHDRLPQLLASRVPLAGYRVETLEPSTCRVHVEIAIQESGNLESAIQESAGQEPAAQGPGTRGQVVAVDYGPIPVPDENGIITIDGQPHVVVPTASEEALDQAVMRCIGEQMYEAVERRLGQAPADMAWDESIARAFLPLDTWIEAFLRTTAQRLDTTNWHALHTHLRRIIIQNRKRVIAPGQMGRVDPFETPEGPNIGRVFTIAAGAEIRGERLVIIDDRPEGALGPNALMVPFLEHDDANRLLMGVNMMRQGLVPAQAEPALVQTGNEPEDAGPDFWCGRNLLTAFISAGEGSVEDGLILSESAARRLDYPYPAEPGDKLANKHGTKGVVSQVLPDAQMPHLPDGTPVEIVFSFTGLFMRLNFGQIREAVMGRIAKAEGKPAIIPPFHAPSEAEIRARLAQAGLPESGMERLYRGQDGPELEMESTVGYVYWYRLAHLARPKLHVVGMEAPAGRPASSEQGPYPFYPGWEGGEVIGDLVIKAMTQAGALANAREMMTTRALDSSDAPYLRRLNARLAPTGIALRVENGRLVSQLQPPEKGVALASPFHHPWLREITVERVGPPPEGSVPTLQKAYQSLVEANQRLERWLASPQHKSAVTGEPVSNRQRLAALLASWTPGEEALVGRLTPPELEVMRLFAQGISSQNMAALLRVSEQTVETYLYGIFTKLSAAPGIDPAVQAEILREIKISILADTSRAQPAAQADILRATTSLHASSYLNTLIIQVENRLGAYFDALLPQEALQANEPQRLSARAVIAPGVGLRLDQVGLPREIAQVLFAQWDQDLSDTWVVVLRAPAVTPTALVAFHPVIVDGPAIRLHPQATDMLNADFDGDQVSVFLPIAQEAQREAGEKLSVAGHLRRDPSLAAGMLNPHGAVWGMAWRSLEEAGRAEIARLLGVEAGQIAAPLARTPLGGLAQALVQREGAEAALPRLEALARMGYQASTNGASLSPFPDAGLELPPQPESDDPAAWEPYLETVRELILSRRDYTNPVLGPQLLSAAVRPRSRWVLPFFLGPRMGSSIDEQPVIIRHSNVQGFTPDELSAWVAGARRGLAQLALQAEQVLQPPTLSAGMDTTPITLLARARASRRPGIIFARAAVSGEADPLQDAESRVLVGL